MVWEDEFTYLKARKILSRNELQELLDQIASVINREVLPLKKQIEEYQTATGWAKVIELEKELERVKRQRNIEQGAWEDVKKYQNENIALKKTLQNINAIAQQGYKRRRDANEDSEVWSKICKITALFSVEINDYRGETQGGSYEN